MQPDPDGREEEPRGMAGVGEGASLVGARNGGSQSADLECVEPGL